MGARGRRVVAVDLGAASGRVLAVDVRDGRLDVTEVSRWANAAVPLAGTLYWDGVGLYREMLAGLAAAAAGGPVAAVGIDSWAVDYGLVRADGSLLSAPVSYRDDRTVAAYGRVVAEVGEEAIWQHTGIALQRFNTLYQLAADAAGGHLDGAGRLLLIPDLLAYFLTGRQVAELTNASTTQLLGLDGRWDPALVKAAGADTGLLAPLVAPGDTIGLVRDDVAAEAGLGAESAGGIPVVAVGSHDTASAVVAVPATGPDFAYISCGTWSLVGVELSEPVVTGAALHAGFTNERGVDGTFRFLRNVMGLWLLQESVRTWSRSSSVDLPSLLDAASRLPALRSVIDADDPAFLPPGDMPARIADACRRWGQPVPDGPAETTRCILDSLAVAYRRGVDAAAALSGRSRPEAVHLLGGGSNNELLCQLTADACGLPVVAGPAEATALGNAAVSARALGALDGGLGELRAAVRASSHLRRYRPDPALAGAWAEAAARIDSGAPMS